MKKMQFNWKKNWMKVVMPTGAVVIAVIGIVVACVQPNNRMYNTTLQSSDILSNSSNYTASGSNYTFTGNVSSSYETYGVKDLDTNLKISGDSGTRTVTGDELKDYLGWATSWTDANSSTSQTLSTSDINFNNVDKMTNTTIAINEKTDTTSNSTTWTSFTITLTGGDWYGGSPNWYIQFEFDNPSATSSS